MMVLVRNAVRAVQVFSENVRTKARQLRREKRRAEGLVYQMLPRSGHWHHPPGTRVISSLFSGLLLTI